MPATTNSTNSTSQQPTMFPRANALSMKAVKPATEKLAPESTVTLASKSPSSMFPRASTLSMGSSTKHDETGTESPRSVASTSSTLSKATVLSQQSMTVAAFFVGSKVL
ncbi:hypothetical protein BJ741DRAFT_705247 [Chytriomyces cf. hyalinus JEL632]|nr:hypothetical protein BJ741DRAFT_705247 [Chytriomyces cf. hyalinus JEL632]